MIDPRCACVGVAGARAGSYDRAMIGPEIELNETEGVAIARGLHTVAHCDGAFDDREKALIDALLPAGGAPLTDIGAEEVAGALRTEAARLFLSSCYLVAMADGTFTDGERSLIEGYAAALKVPAEELATIAQSVKEHLLSPFSRLANTNAVVEVSKKLPV